MNQSINSDREQLEALSVIFLEQQMGTVYLAQDSRIIDSPYTMEINEQWKILLCLSGNRCHRFLMDGVFVSVCLQPFDILIVCPHVLIETWYECSNEALSLVVENDLFRLLLVRCRLSPTETITRRGTPELVVSERLTSQSPASFKKNHEFLITLLEKTKQYPPVLAKQIVGLLPFLVHDLLGNLALKEQELAFPKSGWTWRRIKNYMQENFHLPLQRDLVAADLQLHKSHLSKIFSRHGTTFSNYLNLVRIQKAKEMLLAQPELTVSQIAGRIGYENLGYFFRVFKQELGLAPQAYRKQNAKS